MHLQFMASQLLSFLILPPSMAIHLWHNGLPHLSMKFHSRNHPKNFVSLQLEVLWSSNIDKTGELFAVSETWINCFKLWVQLELIETYAISFLQNLIHWYYDWNGKKIGPERRLKQSDATEPRNPHHLSSTAKAFCCNYSEDSSAEFGNLLPLASR